MKLPIVIILLTFLLGMYLSSISKTTEYYSGNAKPIFDVIPMYRGEYSSTLEFAPECKYQVPTIDMSKRNNLYKFGYTPSLYLDETRNIDTSMITEPLPVSPDFFMSI